MPDRTLGCICELDPKTGEPVVLGYALCPIHKPDAPTPESIAKTIFQKHLDICESNRAARWHSKITIDAVLQTLDTFHPHEYTKVLIPIYQSAKKAIEEL